MNAIDLFRRGGAAAAVTAGLLFSLPAGAFATENTVAAGQSAALPAVESQAGAVAGSTVAAATPSAGSSTDASAGADASGSATSDASAGGDENAGSDKADTGSSAEGSAGEAAGAEGSTEGGEGSQVETETPDADGTAAQKPAGNSAADGSASDGSAKAEGSVDEGTTPAAPEEGGAASAPEQVQPEAKGETTAQPAPAYKNQWGTDANGRVTWFDKDGKAAASKESGWVVTGVSYKGTTTGLQRYWIDKDRGLVTSELVDAGDGWWAYAKDDGTVVRGRWTDPSTGYVYYADNDGRLWSEGWHVADLGQGLQRYWVDADAHAAKPGYSADGWDHYTTSAGYVARGRVSVQREGRTYTYLASNDGKLERTGWLVSSAYGQGLQRYYIDATEHAAISGYSTDSYAHFTTSAGYVLRGGMNDGGRLRWADNDGRAFSNGWLITSALGQGLQRYWFVDGATAAEGAYKTGASSWTYVTSAGYVLRGAKDSGAGYVYLANNDGMLASVAGGQGWIVTDIYGSGLQRYYLTTLASGAQAARSGFFKVDGYGSSFGVGGAGYVLRGKTTWDSHVLLADNDGRLATGAGMIVTGAYDGGTLQRYYLEVLSGVGDFYGAKTGLFTENGQTHFGFAGSGYLERNARKWHGVNYYAADNDGVLVRVDNDYTRTVTAYINWALGIAADDSHGYDQAYRWNERGDFDCSSFVISALRSAGVNTYGASYTGNMRSQLLRGRFQLVFDFSTRQRGDILLADGHHTALYLGDDQLVHASANEYGDALGGRPGDQTGKEIYVRSYYNRPWYCILRYIEG